jgi:hypothetical protein
MRNRTINCPNVVNTRSRSFRCARSSAYPGSGICGIVSTNSANGLRPHRR